MDKQEKLDGVLVFVITKAYYENYDPTGKVTYQEMKGSLIFGVLGLGS